jgi:hypothetical protein
MPNIFVEINITICTRVYTIVCYQLTRNLGCYCRRGMDWWVGLLTTCTHVSELQVSTALSLIYTFYKSPQHPLSRFPACCVNSRFLVTDIKQWRFFSFSLSGPSFKTPQNWLPTINWTIAPSLLSLSCRAQLNWISPILAFIITLHGPHRKHRYPIVACVFVSAETCLLSRCSKTAVATAVLVACFEVFAYQQVCTPQVIYHKCE